MKFYLKILFLLTVLIIITYKIVIAVNKEEVNRSVFDSIKENFSGGTQGKYEGSEYIGTSKMTTTNFLIKDNSCSMLH